MGRNPLSHGSDKTEYLDRVKQDIKDIKYVEEHGKKAFQEGGQFNNIIGTERADYLVRQVAISYVSGCDITHRYQPTDCYPGSAGVKNPYGFWSLDDKKVTDDQIDKALDKLKLRSFMTEKYQKSEEKVSLKDKLFGKILKNADDAKDDTDKQIDKKGPEKA